MEDELETTLDSIPVSRKSEVELQRELEALKPYIMQFVDELLSGDRKPNDLAAGDFPGRLNAFRRDNVTNFRSIGNREDAALMERISADAVFVILGGQIREMEREPNPIIARANRGKLKDLKLIKIAARVASGKDNSEGRYKLA